MELFVCYYVSLTPVGIYIIIFTTINIPIASIRFIVFLRLEIGSDQVGLTQLIGRPCMEWLIGSSELSRFIAPTHTECMSLFLSPPLGVAILVHYGIVAYNGDFW